MRVRLRFVWACVALVALIGAIAPVAAGGAPRAAFGDWPTYHLDALRTGYDPSTPPIGTLSQAWSVPLDGAVYGEPLMVGGRLFAATENDTLYALDPATGGVLWSKNVGTPVPLSDLPCGNIDPLGITGTPVYDPVTDRLFAVAERLHGDGSITHDLYAFDPSTGHILGSRRVDPRGSNPTVEQQRPALALGSGRVYVDYGALAGDCGGFHGQVVASATSLKGKLDVFIATKYEPQAQEGGIWATPGPVIDPDGNVFVAVGNGRSSDPYDYSDSVLKLTKTVHLRTYFAPTTWKSDNAHDQDLGSMSPTLVGTSYIYQDGKLGTGYLIKQGHLGHIGGEIDSATVCRAFGGTAVVGTKIYVPCLDGLRAVDVGAGSIKILWHTTTTATGPPVVGGGAVWSVDIANGVLYALAPSTGAKITSISLGPVPHFATPMLSGGYAFVGTMTGVVAIKGA